MKKLFFFLLPILVISCKGVEQHRAGIEGLSATWDTTTKAVTDFKAMVSNDLTNYNQMLAGMQPAADVKAKMKPAEVTAWDASMKTVTDALGAFGPLQKTINDFEATWTEKSAEVATLKEGLASGKLEGDVAAKLTDLNAMVATANENLTTWTAAYASVKGTVDAALTSLRQGTTGGSATLQK